MEPESKERTELRHEPVPGYPRIFLIAITVGTIYLGFIFLEGLF